MENKIIVAVKGVILNNGKVLIIKRSNYDGVAAGGWECVGGKIEFGEGLEEALMREAKEEVGLNITVDKLLYATTFKISPVKQCIVLTYLCRSEKTEVILSKEHTNYLWATKEELREKLMRNIIEDFDRNNVFLEIE
ncbi:MULTISPECIES: NUDIX hydrolase [Clostridium]|uniref:Nucleoside triphosphatase NudI n=2 Tax=Clostridium TaxID=1485 RepID=A0A151AMZ0_9CLOT|nr:MULTISPECIES: NUDIX domain-containing protein [Clostridium]KYH28996.1 nucleoside triphosphatase NudI [Clostridium colicanis DSM 13634]MBE6044809.1 NUDIX domain-containing protein [Clostridium thermopalmarium]PRR73270.1 Nucleoside triphosphatase NudI [Clostridium thermopalmarium DSM 5974]PVZ25167.1 8-oxo-dGTP diphosphatase [Clostridium thermopalmarium DSM 5974]